MAIAMNKIEKLITYGSLVAMVVGGLGYMGLAMPRPVWASDFKELKLEIYEEQLYRTQRELTNLQYDIAYKRQYAKEEPPEPIKGKVKELEEDIGMLKRKIENIEYDKHRD